jgi:hypothetical protein
LIVTGSGFPASSAFAEDFDMATGGKEHGKLVALLDAQGGGW